jgi:hypothetical protein
MGRTDKGVSGTEVDKGCNRVMKDQAKMDRGEKWNQQSQMSSSWEKR